MSKVVVGLSGGVDSAVSAYLLKEQGYEVIGVYVAMLSEKYGFERTAEDAKNVAQQLGIEFHVLDGKEIFEQKVIVPFMENYFHGFTPSPCLVCNRYIKFGFLAEYMQELGCDYLATGHYVGLREKEDGSVALICGEDKKKDQSYFLYGIKREWLKHLIFPLAKYTKTEIKEIARKIGLTVVDKPESQEICFVAENDYKKFLQTYGKQQSKKGNFINLSGQKIGMHNGIEQYTIGQRKGLGIALGKPQYVVKIDAINNQVVLGDKDDLFGSVLIATENNFLKEVTIGESLEIKAKVRYRAQMADARLYRLNEKDTRVEFQEPQRAITPGQGVCYYLEDEVLGGGTIVEVIDSV